MEKQKPLKEDEPKKEIVDDDGLDALLDDALQDFGKTREPKKTPSKGQPKSEEQDLGEMLDEDALLKMSEGWNEVLKEMSDGDPALLEEFQKFQKNRPGSDSGQAGANNETGSTSNFDSYMESALKDLEGNLSGLNFEGDENGMDEFSEMMKEMQSKMGTSTVDGESGAEEAFPDGDAFMGMMQGMMQNLLSKDLLYPSLNELREKYPSWLSDNKEKLTQDDYSKYKNQNDIIIQLCDLFEEESENDTDMVKKNRTEQVVDLMQKMQVYGQPPSDILSDSNISPPTMPQQCSIM